MFKGLFKVPFYYKNFKCKGGKCNNVCCSKWNITLTQDEYFKIMNLKVSPKLKEKIDTYVGLYPNPSFNKYARINLDYNGYCPLRLENGFCGLQCETSEEKIPSVCRYYPRSPKLYPRKECVISSSCERVIELLMENNAPFSFIKTNLSFKFDDNEDKELENKEDLNKMDYCLNVLNDRNINIIDRIFLLINYVNPSFKEDEKINNRLFEKIKDLYSRSFSINSYLEKCNYLINIKEAYEKLIVFYPNLSFWLEKILSNHIFYMKYPYVQSNLDIKDASYGLYYIVLFSLNFVLNYSENHTKEEFIDVICNSFRLYEHSPFYYNIAYLVLSL